MSESHYKKIIFFDFANLAYGGGCEQNFLRLGRWLAGHNYNVNFITPSQRLNSLFSYFPGISAYKSNLSRQELDSQLGKNRHITFEFRDLFFPTENRRIVVEQLNKADSIISKNEIFEVLLLKYIFRVKMEKVVFGFHTPIYYPSTKSRKSRIHNFLYNSKFYFNLLKSSKIRFLVLSENDKSILNKYGLYNGKVIPNPVNIDKFAQKEYAKGSNFEVYFIGRMTEQKGVDILAKAVEILSKNIDFKKINFSFVGSGLEENVLRELATKYPNCTFLGFKTDVVEYYHRADLVVVPSRWESFCYAVAEAQSCGVPVIASNITGPKDIVIDNETGWLIESENADLLQKAISKSFTVWEQNYTVYSDMGKKGRQNIVEQFEENHIDSMIEEFIFK